MPEGLGRCPRAWRCMFAAIIITGSRRSSNHYYLDCFHPPWLLDLVVYDRAIFIHGLVPCSHTNCILTQGEKKEREKTLQNCYFLCLGSFGPRARAGLRAWENPAFPNPSARDPSWPFYITNLYMNVPSPESDSCLTMEILLLAFWKPLERSRR